MWSPWRWETRTASMSSHVYPPSESAWASPRWEGSPASNSRTVPPCSTSMRFPELPLRSGRTANPLLKGQKLQPGSFVRGSRGADAQNLEDHRFDHDERLAFLPDAPGQDLLSPPERGGKVDRGRAVACGDASHPHDLERIGELLPDRVRGEGRLPGPGHHLASPDRPEKEEPSRGDPLCFAKGGERRHDLLSVVEPGEHDPADLPFFSLYRIAHLGDHGAYLVNTKSFPFTSDWWQGKQVPCCVSSAGFPFTNRPNPHPPVEAYFFAFLTMNSIRCGSPGTNAVSNSADFTRFHANLARIDPSGKGRVPAR